LNTKFTDKSKYANKTLLSPGGPFARKKEAPNEMEELMHFHIWYLRDDYRFWTLVLVILTQKENEKTTFLINSSGHVTTANHQKAERLVGNAINLLNLIM